MQFIYYLLLLTFPLLHVLVLLVSMINGVVTEDVVEKLAGKKLCEIVELK